MKTSYLITLLFSLALSLGLFLTLTPGRVHAAGPITVTTAADSDAADSDCSLREALVAANTDTAYNGCPAGSGADGITFAGNYTITLTSALPAITSSVTITGTGTANTIIQASTCNPVTLPGGCTPATHRVFTVMTGTVILNDMTVRHGACKTGGACSIVVSNGGNIYATAANLTLDAVNVQSGYASSLGGGIYSTKGNLTLLNNSLIGGEGAGNSTGGDGGGIYFRDGQNLVVDNSRVLYNYASNYAGGLYFEGNNTTAVIQNGSQIDHNTAEPNGGDYAGGLYAFGTNCLLTIADSSVSHNLSGGPAGGLWTACATTLTGSTIFSNTTTNNGGGVHIHTSGIVTVTNSTIYSNTATGVTKNGGGIYNAGTLTVINSTVAGNSTTANGGGIYTQGTLHLKNTILANSPSGGDCYNLTGDTIATNTTNLIETNGAAGHMCGTPAFTADPVLGPLSNNGGKTQTMALLTGSPAIDTGDNATCAAAPVNNLDQRGIPRPQGDNCDIGAFEWPVATIYLPIVVKNN